MPERPDRPGGPGRQPPYYLTLQMPGDDVEPAFSLTHDVRAGQPCDLAAFMAVNSDPADPSYGQLRVLALPRNTTFPGRARCRTRSSPTRTCPTSCSRCAAEAVAEVELGNLLTLPVAGGLMYVEPVYARATEGASYPTLRKVIVSFGDQVAITDSYADSLAVFFADVSDGGGRRRWWRRQRWRRRWRRRRHRAAAAGERPGRRSRGVRKRAGGPRHRRLRCLRRGPAGPCRGARARTGRGRGARAGGTAGHAGGNRTRGDAEPLTPSESITPASQSWLGTPGLAVPAFTP